MFDGLAATEREKATDQKWILCDVETSHIITSTVMRKKRNVGSLCLKFGWTWCVSLATKRWKKMFG